MVSLHSYPTQLLHKSSYHPGLYPGGLFLLIRKIKASAHLFPPEARPIFRLTTRPPFFYFIHLNKISLLPFGKTKTGERNPRPPAVSFISYYYFTPRKCGDFKAVRSAAVHLNLKKRSVRLCLRIFPFEHIIRKIRRQQRS